MEVINKEEKRKLKNRFKWGLLLHYKQVLSRIIFIISILGMVSFFTGMNNNFNNAISDLNNSFSSNQIYYKDNKTKLNMISFYDDIISKLPYEVKNYFYSYYSEGMYEAKVSSKDIYLGDGFLFSNVIYMEGLKDNEVVLSLDWNKLCVNNNYSYASFNYVKEKLIGEKLIYKYDGKIKEYLIKDVIFSKTEAMYVSEINEFLNTLKDMHKFDISVKNYYLMIRNDKLSQFYEKINSVDSLLKYNFDYLYEDDCCSYFLVSESEYTYFNGKELQDNYLVCSDIGYSCSTLDFSIFSSLYYIEDYYLKDKVKYANYSKELNYNEVVVSRGLFEYLNEKEILNLKFYFDDSFHVLNDVKVVDVIEENEFKIYHSKYDYLLFKEKFNKNIRINYIYSNDDLDHEKKPCLYYEDINETKDMIFRLIGYIKMVVTIFVLMMLVLFFVVEVYKLNKYFKYFEFLNNNKEDFARVYDAYMLWYLLIGAFCFKSILILFCYYLVFWLFYIVMKRKIKSRLTLD